MQKIVADTLRPPGKGDALGVAQAKAQLATAYDCLEDRMTTRRWAVGDVFTLADCAAAPALFYADLVLPFRDTHANVARYFDRLMARASFARVLKEAGPYLASFPEAARARPAGLVRA